MYDLISDSTNDIGMVETGITEAILLLELLTEDLWPSIGTTHNGALLDGALALLRAGLSHVGYAESRLSEVMHRMRNKEKEPPVEGGIKQHN